MANDTNICELHSFSTSTNLRHYLTVLNANVPNCYITFLEQQTPDFVPPTLWPPNSSDLNPVDYSVWSFLQEKVYRSKIADIDELETRLVNEWAQFDQSIIDAYIIHQPVAPPSERLCPCTWGTLRAQVLTILNTDVIKTYNFAK